MKIKLEAFRPTLASMLGSGVLIAGLIVVLLSTMGSQDKQLLEDQNEIKDICIRAFELTHGGTTQLPEPYRSDPTTAVPDDVKAMLQQNIIATLPEVYSADSPVLTSRIELMQREVVRQRGNGYRDLGGGMRWIRNVTIQVNGDNAVMEADIRGWGSFTDQGLTFTPENTAHHRWVLAREHDSWRITQEEFTFWPGEEP